MALNDTTPLSVLILGGGVAGLTEALALTKYAPATATPRIDVYEIRPEPGVIGGAVNLTPNALRLLDHLGVLAIMRERRYGITVDAVEVFSIYSPAKLGESSFRGADGEGLGSPPYKALRITRADVMKALVEAISHHPNITFTCGKKTTQIAESASNITLTFSDNTTATGDLLIGADGIHSATRLLHIDPSRKEIYSGIANAFGFAPFSAEKMPLHYSVSAINFARRGMLLTSFHEESKESAYVGALLQVPEIESRDGWKVKGADQEATRRDVLDRFGDTVFPAIVPMIEGARDWFMWPVFTLPPGGKWATDRAMLLGDAAHAMPPQGESTGIVLEDTVLFARCVARQQALCSGTLKDAFDAYEKLRRARIDAAFKESGAVVKTVQDSGWLGHTIKSYVIPWFLWWTRASREKHFVEDVTTSDLGF